MTNPDDPNEQPTAQPSYPPPTPPQPSGGPGPVPPPPGQPGYPPPGGQHGYPPPGGQHGYPPPGGQYLPPAPAVPPAYGYGQAAPGSVPPGMFHDPASGLVLPQGTELASVGRRIGAFFLSYLLLIVTLVIGYIIWGLIVWGRGQTPALQVLGMRVWRPDDRRVASWGYMALREIVGRIVDGILSFITEITSFVMMLAGRQRKTLHDMVAGTVVLYDPNKVLAG